MFIVFSAIRPNHAQLSCIVPEFLSFIFIVLIMLMCNNNNNKICYLTLYTAMFARFTAPIIWVHGKLKICYRFSFKTEPSKNCHLL